MSSPQGRFAAGAALLDGAVLGSTDAHGKQMFLGFRPVGAAARTRPRQWLRVHLGLYGKWTFGPLGDDGPPAPRGALRVRIEGDREYADLRGPTGCEVVTTAEKDLVHARLGPDPLRRDGSADRFVQRVLRSRSPLATLLMDQSVVAGVGNVYRAEVLYRHQLHPYLPGRSLGRDRWAAVWADLVALMADGVRTGRIRTLRVEHGRRRRSGARYYVYRRAGERCLVCADQVVVAELEGRRLYWCPSCQAGDSGSRS